MNKVFLLVMENTPSSCPIPHVQVCLSEEEARTEMNKGYLQEGRIKLYKASILAERAAEPF